MVRPASTIRITGAHIVAVAVQGRPLRRVTSRRHFASDTFLTEPDGAHLAFSPTERHVTLTLQTAASRSGLSKS